MTVSKSYFLCAYELNIRAIKHSPGKQETDLFIFVHAVILNLNTHGVYSGRDRYRKGRKVSRNTFILLHRGRMNTLSSLDNSCTKALWIWITYLISHVKYHVHYFPQVFPPSFCSGVERLRVWVTNAWWICWNKIRSHVGLNPSVDDFTNKLIFPRNNSQKVKSIMQQPIMQLKASIATAHSYG